MDHLTRELERCWQTLCGAAKGAAVFVDDAAAEAVRWGCGTSRLLAGGALMIRSLQVFVCVVIFLSLCLGRSNFLLSLSLSLSLSLPIYLFL